MGHLYGASRLGKFLTPQKVLLDFPEKYEKYLKDRLADFEIEVPFENKQMFW